MSSIAISASSRVMTLILPPKFGGCKGSSAAGQQAAARLLRRRCGWARCLTRRMSRRPLLARRRVLEHHHPHAGALVVPLRVDVHHADALRTALARLAPRALAVAVLGAERRHLGGHLFVRRILAGL